MPYMLRYLLPVVHLCNSSSDACCAFLLRPAHLCLLALQESLEPQHRHRHQALQVAQPHALLLGVPPLKAVNLCMPGEQRVIPNATSRSTADVMAKSCGHPNTHAMSAVASVLQHPAAVPPGGLGTCSSSYPGGRACSSSPTKRWYWGAPGVQECMSPRTSCVAGATPGDSSLP